MGVRRRITVQPSAARLTSSLRDIGYDFPSAVADLVDNSIAAAASRVEIEIEFAGADSRVVIADDGCGMTANGLVEALRFGSRRLYGRGDLGRYGLGLKTASLSQCRTLTAASRKPDSSRTSIRQLDLDLIAEWDEWLIVDPGRTGMTQRSRELLDRGFSTVIVWENLDRVLPEKRPEGPWAKRRFDSLIRRTGEHLGMVFHHFIAGDEPAGKVNIVVNGEKVRAWNPFAPHESATITLPEQIFELTFGEVTGTVRLARYVLPPRVSFSSIAEFERMSGPLKWNRQQGLYIYRAGRLVQWSGWAGFRGIDEHTKLARAALDFDTDLDLAFNINVAKMRVSIPPQLRQMLERPIHDLCIRADDTYRKTAKAHADPPVGGPQNWASPRQLSANHRPASPASPRPASATTAGLALRAAALQVGQYDALRAIANVLLEQAPELARGLGLDGL